MEKNKICAIDRIVGNIAICECLETGKSTEIDINRLPKVKEGDIIRFVDGVFVVDHDKTKQRLAALTERMNKLFEKSRGKI